MKKIIIVALLVSLGTSVIGAASIKELLNETQRTFGDTDYTLVWWAPSEYWAMSLDQTHQLTEQQKEAAVEVFDDYSVFIIVKATVGPFCGITFADRDEIQAGMSLKVNDKTIPLLSHDELSPDAQNFFSIMGPTMKNDVGQFGEGMEFFVYPNTKDGKKIIDPLKEGTVEYSVFGRTEEWWLPLESLLPPMYDAKTGEQFPGNYIFNPFTGEKLVKEPKQPQVEFSFHLPVTEKAEAEEGQNKVLISITNEEIRLNGTPIELEDISEHLSSTNIVELIPADDVSHTRIVDVMDECAEANVKNLTFSVLEM
jgi:hypothetical protein